MDEAIRKRVGKDHPQPRDPLARLQELNRSLKALGVKHKPDPGRRPPRKQVGRVHDGE